MPNKAVEQSDTASSNTTPCHGRAYLHSLLAQDLAAAAMCARAAQPKTHKAQPPTKYKLRPRRTPRLTQVALQGRGQKQDKSSVKEVEPARQADSLSSKVSEDSPMVADVSHRHRRSDVEEQVALVDTLNMLSQLYRDQAGAYHAHFEVMRDMGGIWGIEDHCRRYTMDNNNPLQTDVRKALLRLQMEMTLSEKASEPARPPPHPSADGGRAPYRDALRGV
eukprot:jgi/Ulvmu1/118/UM001_0122.1